VHVCFAAFTGDTDLRENVEMIAWTNEREGKAIWEKRGRELKI
jgi:hypothetical protein